MTGTNPNLLPPAVPAVRECLVELIKLLDEPRQECNEWADDWLKRWNSGLMKLNSAKRIASAPDLTYIAEILAMREKEGASYGITSELAFKLISEMRAYIETIPPTEGEPELTAMERMHRGRLAEHGSTPPTEDDARCTARYRWLRVNATEVIAGQGVDVQWGCDMDKPEDLDTAIDAAMRSNTPSTPAAPLKPEDDRT